MTFFLMKAVVVFSLFLLVNGNNCHHQLNCDECISNGCKFYVTDTSGFCGRLDLNPKLYLFRVSRISSCSSASAASTKGDKYVAATNPILEKVFPSSWSGGGKDLTGLAHVSTLSPSTRNPINLMPIASPLSSPKNDDVSVKQKVGRNRIDASGMVSLLCKQYKLVFESIHPKRDAEVEEKRCLKKLSF